MAQTAWTAPLLKDAGHVDAKPLRRAVIVFLGVALFTGLGLVTLLSSNDATNSDASGATQSQLATINATLTDEDSSQMCWHNSGGTCRLFWCHGDRGPTFCYDALCMCQPGSCSGPDGVCYSGQNTPLASGIKFRNEQWPSMYLQLKTDGQQGPNHYIEIGSDGTAFDLTRIVGSGDKFAVNFATSDLPGMMMRVDPRHKRPSGKYGDDPMFQTPVKAWDRKGYWPIPMGGDAYAFTLKIVKDSPQTVTIESRQFEGRYVFAGKDDFVSTVKTMIVDPGAEGHWIPEPPLALQ